MNNVLEDIIRLYRGELSVCRAAFHFQGIQKYYLNSGKTERLLQNKFSSL